MSAYLEAVSAADVGADAFRTGARSRREAVEEAQRDLSETLARSPAAPIGDVLEAWPRLTTRQKNRALSGLIEGVVVRRVGAGRVVPVEDRISIVASGSGVIPRYRGGGEAMGIVPLDDLDGVTTLGG
jgi:hypothetical protein